MRCLGYDVWEWAELVSGLLGISKARVLVGDVKGKALWKVFEEVLKYPRGYPVQYILRKAVFYGFEFYVEEGVFIPRSDTEKIVDIVLKLAPRNGKVLDLCTGSGVIGITLKLLRPDLKVFLSDKDKKALKVAKLNSERLGADVFIVGCDLLDCFKGKFDILVSNPPYIPVEDVGKYDKKVIFEAKDALVGGDTGFEITQRIIENAIKVLGDGGYLILETDPQHFPKFPPKTKFIDRFAILNYETLKMRNQHPR